MAAWKVARQIPSSKKPPRGGRTVAALGNHDFEGSALSWSGAWLLRTSSADAQMGMLDLWREARGQSPAQALGRFDAAA